MKKETFCENCRDYREYTIEKKKVKEDFKGTEYEYNIKIATCNKCKQEIDAEDVIDYNLNSLYTEIRKKNDIISLEDIIYIPEKYNIWKKPLSLLLGWGEITFTRFYDGDMPTKQYSNILKKILEDPEYYLKTIDKNKEKAIKAYNKSKVQVEKLL